MVCDTTYVWRGVLFPMVDGGNCKTEQVKVLHLSLKHQQADFHDGWDKDDCDGDI